MSNSKIRYSKESLIKTYRSLYGNTFVDRDTFRKETKISSNTIMNHFGTYGNFLDELGVNKFKNSIKNNSNTVETVDTNSQAVNDKVEIDVDSKNQSGSVLYIGKHLKTLEQLIEECEIDTNIWEVEGHTVNRWEVNIRVGDEIHTVPSYHVKAFLKKKAIATVDNLIEYFKEACEKIPKSNIKPFVIKKSNKNDLEPVLLEIDIMDAHIGKFCWAEEANSANYDTNIALNLVNQSIEYFLNKSSHLNVEKILFPIGNDFFNSEHNFRTSGGITEMHDDTRWQKSFKKALDLITTTVQKISLSTDISCPIVIGNHDEFKIQYFGFALSAFFTNNPRVEIDNRPIARKYIKYHNNLIGYCHGNDVKTKELPMLMSIEAKEDWASTEHKYINTGHVHHENSQEIYGINVRSHSSQVPSDKWHFSRGFVGSKRQNSAKAYDREDGLIQTFYYKVKE